MISGISRPSAFPQGISQTVTVLITITKKAFKGIEVLISGMPLSPAFTQGINQIVTVLVTITKKAFKGVDIVAGVMIGGFTLGQQVNQAATVIVTVTKKVFKNISKNITGISTILAFRISRVIVRDRIRLEQDLKDWRKWTGAHDRFTVVLWKNPPLNRDSGGFHFEIKKRDVRMAQGRIPSIAVAEVKIKKMINEYMTVNRKTK